MSTPNLDGQPLLGARYALDNKAAASLHPAQLAARLRIEQQDRADDYERSPCPCGANRDGLLSEVDRHGLSCRTVICLACALIRTDPRWTEARYQAFYEHDYRELYNASQVPKEQWAADVAANAGTKARARWIQAVAGRFEKVIVLEIGAGAGWNLAPLPRTWERIGYDVDDDYLELGRQIFGLDMRHGFVSEALTAVGFADLVVLSHVVEHFPDPERELRKIAAHLRPQALVLIEVPGIFRLHRTNLDPMTYWQNAHTYTFCASTLRALCERSGLRVLSVDETARAVCGVGTAVTNRPPQVSALRIVRYLQNCERGIGPYRRLRRIPLVGRGLASLWRRTYYQRLSI